MTATVIICWKVVMMAIQASVLVKSGVCARLVTEKSDVLERLGNPDEKSSITKNSEHMWGPIETLWYKIEMGNTIETWTYQTSSGRKELYFINSSSKVADEHFWYNDSRKNPTY